MPCPWLCAIILTYRHTTVPGTGTGCDRLLMDGSADGRTEAYFQHREIMACATNDSSLLRRSTTQ